MKFDAARREEGGGEGVQQQEVGRNGLRQGRQHPGPVRTFSTLNRVPFKENSGAFAAKRSARTYKQEAKRQLVKEAAAADRAAAV